MATITFDHTMPSRLDEASLFTWLVDTLRDTDAVALWPRHLNRVRIPRMEVGQPFEAEYRGPFGAVSRLYVLAGFEVGRSLTYRPGPGHPFQGRVYLRVEPHSKGSALRWFGTYEVSPWRPERLYFRFYFEPRFFAALGAGLRRLRPA